MTPHAFKVAKISQNESSSKPCTWWFFWFFYVFYFWVVGARILHRREPWHHPWGGTCPLQKKVGLARGLPEPTYKAGYTDGVLGRNSRCRAPRFWSPEPPHAPAGGEAQPRQRGSFKAGSSSVLVGSYQVSFLH
jgi:hypothetical protein